MATDHVFAPRRSDMQVPIDLVWVAAFLAIAPLFVNDAIGPLSPMFLLAFGGLLALRSIASTVQDLIDFRWLMVYPAYTVLSTLWSNYPLVSLRHSVQLLITFALGIVVARCLTTKGFHRIFFFAFAAAILISILSGRTRSDGIAIGLFNSKNSYAAALAICILASVAMFLDTKAHIVQRGFGVVMVFAGLFGLVKAESAGTVLTLIPALFVGVSVLALGRLHPQLRGAVVVLGLAAAVLFGGFALLLGHEILALVLETAGKDATLTGRTELWETAKNFIGQRPFFGVGYQAFWVQGFAPAEFLWRKFMIASRSGFNFHNVYYESAVQLGVVGVLMIVTLLLWAFVSALKAGIRQPSAPAVFIISMLVFMMLRSFGEVGPFFEFRGWTVFIVGVLIFYGTRSASRDPQTVDRPATRPAVGSFNVG